MVPLIRRANVPMLSAIQGWTPVLPLAGRTMTWRHRRNRVAQSRHPTSHPLPTAPPHSRQAPLYFALFGLKWVPPLADKCPGADGASGPGGTSACHEAHHPGTIGQGAFPTPPPPRQDSGLQRLGGLVGSGLRFRGLKGLVLGFRKTSWQEPP